jgi:hypothetical protein
MREPIGITVPVSGEELDKIKWDAYAEGREDEMEAQKRVAHGVTDGTLWRKRQTEMANLQRTVELLTQAVRDLQLKLDSINRES